MTTLTFYGIRELTPGPRWRQLFDATWSGYRNWYLSEGEFTRPSLESAHRMLQRHMPELTGTWEHLVELSGGDEQPPGCSPCTTRRGSRLDVRKWRSPARHRC